MKVIHWMNIKNSSNRNPIQSVDKSDGTWNELMKEVRLGGERINAEVIGNHKVGHWTNGGSRHDEDWGLYRRRLWVPQLSLLLFGICYAVRPKMVDWGGSALAEDGVYACFVSPWVARTADQTNMVIKDNQDIVWFQTGYRVSNFVLVGESVRKILMDK